MKRSTFIVFCLILCLTLTASYAAPKELFYLDEDKGVWVCVVCAYEYNPDVGDPEHDIPAGTKFEDLPDDWECPECGCSHSDFEIIIGHLNKVDKQHTPKGTDQQKENVFSKL